MYTIMMNDDKSLITTVKTTIYQREKLVDKIRFLFPETYEDLTLSECTACLKYLDQGNVAHTEILELEDELYKEKLCYILPVDTELTQFAGDVTIRVTFLNTEEQNVLHTGETTITVTALPDYYSFVVDDSLEVIDQKILELDSKLEAVAIAAELYNSEKADDLSYEDGIAQLLANGNPIGSGQKIPGDEGVAAVEFGDEESDGSDSDDSDDTNSVNVVEF